MEDLNTKSEDSNENHAGTLNDVSGVLMQTSDKMSYAIECPGCEMYHIIHVDRPNHPSWTFNGNVDKPTFTPSLLVTYSWKKEERTCHSFITDGKIQFLSDCTHALAGQTVDLGNVKD